MASLQSLLMVHGASCFFDQTSSRDSAPALDIWHPKGMARFSSDSWSSLFIPVLFRNKPITQSLVRRGYCSPLSWHVHRRAQSFLLLGLSPAPFQNLGHSRQNGTGRKLVEELHSGACGQAVWWIERVCEDMLHHRMMLLLPWGSRAGV